MDGIPACWIGKTVELGLKANLPHCILHRMANQSLGSLPGGTAGGTPYHFHLLDNPICKGHFKFRGTKTLSITAKANLPWKATSGRWRDGGGPCQFFPRGDHRNVLLLT